jgi:opacity protein-like surface antigen
MRRFNLLKSALSVCVLLALAAPLSAQVDEPVNYIGFQAGVYNLDSWDGKVNLGSEIVLNGNLEIDKQFQAGVFLGREYEKARYELEYGRGNFDITDVRLGRIDQAISSSGNYRAWTFNAYRTAEITDHFSGFAGLGIGWGRAELPKIDSDSNCDCMDAAAETGFAYQGRVGIEYQPSEKHNLFVQYTWLKIHGPQSEGSDTGVSYSEKTLGIVGAGYRYFF